MMKASERLTPERIAEIMAFPITYDEDCPKLTKEQLAELRPAHPENFVKGKQPEIAVNAEWQEAALYYEKRNFDRR